VIASVQPNGLARLVLSNPRRRNALSLAMWEQMRAALERFAADDAVRVVVLSGAGEAAFCAGADISEFETERSDPAGQARYNAIADAGQASLVAFPKPIVAMIHGYCMGGGLSLALKADVRIASDEAVFGVPAARLGIAYHYDNLARLVEVVGPAAARDMLLSGRRLKAGEVLRLGLVAQVVPRAALEGEALAYAQAVAENAPLSLRYAKLANEQIPTPRPDRAAAEALAALCMASADYREGRTAFAEKRRPVFSGR
jgi:enoyl-CoA hydratase/carnithine racemase